MECNSFSQSWDVAYCQPQHRCLSFLSLLQVSVGTAGQCNDNSFTYHCECNCRFYPSLEWYVDVSLVLIERAGEFASKEIWHSIVQLITSYPQLHGYAASKARALNDLRV